MNQLFMGGVPELTFKTDHYGFFSLIKKVISKKGVSNIYSLTKHQFTRESFYPITMRADKSYNYCHKPQRKQRLSMTLCQIPYRSEFNKDKTSSIVPGHFLEFYGLRNRLEIMTKLSQIEGVSSTRNPKVSRRTTRAFRAISGLNNPQISRDTRYLQSGFSHPILGKIT